MLEGGYAQIDHDFTGNSGSRMMDAVNDSLNGDACGTGDRVFGRANWKVSPYVSLFGFYTHQVANFYNQSKQGLTGGLTIDFKNILKKYHAL